MHNGLPADMRSSDVRRSMDMLLQELVIAKAKQEVFPGVLERLVDLDLPGPVSGMVRQMYSAYRCLYGDTVRLCRCSRRLTTSPKKSCVNWPTKR